MTIEISELTLSDIPVEIPTVLDDLSTDAADPQWKCSVANVTLPSITELTNALNVGVERIVIMQEDGITVGLTTVGVEDCKLRWLILDTSRYMELATILFDWITNTYGVPPWGIHEGTNSRLQAYLEDPRVVVEHQTVRNGVLFTTVRWS